MEMTWKKFTQLKKDFTQFSIEVDLRFRNISQNFKVNSCNFYENFTQFLG